VCVRACMCVCVYCILTHQQVALDVHVKVLGCQQLVGLCV